jgi:hypothetical protein
LLAVWRGTGEVHLEYSSVDPILSFLRQTNCQTVSYWRETNGQERFAQEDILVRNYESVLGGAKAVVS